MRLTLLEYVQSILSSMNSDEVNSVSDSPESLQVADIVRTTYFNILSRANLPEHKQLVQLEPSLDQTMPVLMYIPDGVESIEWVRYFNSNANAQASTTSQHGVNTDLQTHLGQPPIPPGYEYVTVIPVQQFLDITTAFNPSDSNIHSFTFTNADNSYPGKFMFYYKNDRQPMYCTVISDNYVVFDSYDSTVDSTLQTSKTMAYGEIIPFWQNTDTFIPNIDERQVPLLLNEAKSLAFFEMKQTLHQKAEQESKRQWSSVQKDKSKTDKPSYFDQLPDFGRYGRSSRAQVSMFKLRGWDRP
jgi:hypothetical protein